MGDEDILMRRKGGERRGGRRRKSVCYDRLINITKNDWWGGGRKKEWDNNVLLHLESKMMKCELSFSDNLNSLEYRRTHATQGIFWGQARSYGSHMPLSSPIRGAGTNVQNGTPVLRIYVCISLSDDSKTAACGTRSSTVDQHLQPIVWVLGSGLSRLTPKDTLCFLRQIM